MLSQVVKAMPNTETLSDARPADDYTLTGDFIDVGVLLIVLQHRLSLFQIISAPGKKRRSAKTKLHAPMLDIIGQGTVFMAVGGGDGIAWSPANRIRECWQETSLCTIWNQTERARVLPMSEA